MLETARQLAKPKIVTHPVEAPAAVLTDIVVVGGGIAGASAAYHLARTGLRVTLAERRRLASGVTSQAVGLLSPPTRLPFHQLVHDLGETAARELWQLSLRSVEGLADLLRARGEAAAAQLDLSGGYMLAQPHTEHVIGDAYRALVAAGLPVRWLDAAEVRERVGGRGFSGGYLIERGGAVDPALAARALARAAVAAGARVEEGTRVLRVQPCPGGFRVLTDRGTIQSAAVVYAAHLEGASFLGDLGAEMVPVRAQAFVTAPLPRLFHGSFATEWKTNVWRQRPDGRIVASGWRHEAHARSYGKAAEIDRPLQADLRLWFEQAFPQLAPLPIEGAWSGAWAWTHDHLPLVGGVPGRPGEWVVTGFGGGGLAFAYEAGRAVAHAITGDALVQGAALLDPARLRVAVN